jgi:tRNA pseudouridine55 synthase
LNGFFFIDKPSGPTSFDVVRMVRRACGGKTGHSGTLDPQASGLLICAVGDATRLLPYLPMGPKRYSFGVKFGKETDTLDGEGTVTEEGGRVPSEQELRDALPRFTGSVTQTPPRFSAVRVAGERAYDLARARRDFEIKERTVTVSALSLVKVDGNEATLDATCSAGTYVRSLARDLAHALGTFAIASFIRRVAIGPFSVDDAVPPFAAAEAPAAHIVSPSKALAAVPSVTLSSERLKAVSFGKEIAVDKTDDVVIGFDGSGEVAAVLKRKGDLYHPDKVFVKRGSQG